MLLLHHFLLVGSLSPQYFFTKLSSKVSGDRIEQSRCPAYEAGEPQPVLQPETSEFFM